MCYQFGCGVAEDMNRADALYQQVIKTKPTYARAYYLLAKLHDKFQGESTATTKAVENGASVNMRKGIISKIIADVNGHLKDSKREKADNVPFANTQEGKEVVQNYKRAAELGDEDAKKRLNELSSCCNID
jgi:hypothetical protein